MLPLTLSLLGPFQVALADAPITGFPTDKVRALLAYLALEADRPHRRDTLATLLWPDWSDEIARRNLRQSLHRLKQTLDRHQPGLTGHLLTSTSQTIQLNSRLIWLDVSVLRAYLAAVEAHPHRQLARCRPCLQQLAQAVDLYRGEFLAGFAIGDAPTFEEWLLLERESLHYQVLLALNQLTAAHLAWGDYELAYTFAARQLALEPWREEAHRQVMRALAALGRRSEAIAQYHSCRRLLAEELGVEPVTETETLYRQIETGAFQIGGESFAAVPLHHFPTPFTRFVGRHTELAAIEEMLANPACRLLTLMGPGGIGKTRLAIEAAGRLAANNTAFFDGLYFVSLSAVPSADFLPAAIAGSLGLTLQGAQPVQAQLLAALRPKELLLILDNFEQLPGSPAVIATLLTNAPAVKLLITAREPLNLQGEWRLPIGGLDYAGTTTAEEATAVVETTVAPTYSAAQLFSQSAAQVQPGFAPSKAEQAAILEICRLVQGMPLALEMAAAWVRMMDCHTIAREIAHNLDLLATPLQDVPDRHRSMRAVFDHSWQQLPPAEQVGLAQLSIIQGNFTLEAALAITEATVLQIASLLDKSLLQRLAENRYTLHPLLRHFLQEKLSQQAAGLPAIQARHASYYLAFVAKNGIALYGESDKEALAAFQLELDNVRPAWQWAATNGRSDLIRRSLDGFYRLYGLAGLWSERHQLLTAALANLHTTPDQTTVSLLLGNQAMSLTLLGDLPAAQTAAQQAVLIAEQTADKECLAKTKGILGWTLHLLGDNQAALPLMEEAAAFLETAGNRYETAVLLIRLGMLHYRREQFNQAQHDYQRAHDHYAALGYQAGIASSLSGLGLVFTDLGRFDEALAAHQKALDIDRELNNTNGTARHLGNIGHIYRQIGELDEALACYQEALQINQVVGNKQMVTLWIGYLGDVYAERGDVTEALACYDQAIPDWREINNKFELMKKVNSKANLLFGQGAYTAAQSLNDEGLQLAQELNNHSYSFTGRLLAAQLALAQEQTEAGQQQLEALLASAERPEEEAAVHYQLWQMGHDEAHGRAALARYEQLANQTPKTEYKKRAEELQQAITHRKDT
jgi:predicted ATPase/DNA-binding SARP family transcriptional activator